MGNPLTLASTVVGLKGHYKSQGLSVPVRSVSPFSDPSSNLAQPSRSGAIRLANRQHGPDDPSVLVGDRDRRARVCAGPRDKLLNLKKLINRADLAADTWTGPSILPCRN